MGPGTRLCGGNVLSTLEHPCRSTVAELAIFMITGHKDKEYGCTQKEMESYGRALFGVAYVSRVENQAKRSSYLFIYFFENFVVILDRAYVH